MKTINRRDFIQLAGGLFALTVSDADILNWKKQLPLSFSTLGCPDWTFDQILDFASAHSYKGIEIRGVGRELDLSKSPHFNSPAGIKTTMQKLKSKRLQIVNLGASAAMHYRQGPERTKAMDEARRFIDIARKVDCPYVRVFPNSLPKTQSKEETLELISSGLTELGNYSKGSGVKVLMETHGDLVWVDDIVDVMNRTDGKSVGLVWDIINMWSVTKQPPSDVYPKISKWIHHTHIKDMKLDNGKAEYTLLGQGNTPIMDAIDLLAKNGYKGFYSFEWEKLWHPEIAEPDVAFGEFATVMKQHFQRRS